MTTTTDTRFWLDQGTWLELPGTVGYTRAWPLMDGDKLVAHFYSHDEAVIALDLLEHDWREAQ